MKTRKFNFSISHLFPVFALVILSNSSFAATAPRTVVKTTGVMNATTNVRAKTDATGLYSEECYNAYFGCMDQFCMSDNIEGGRCSCSDENAAFQATYESATNKALNASRTSELEIEKIKTGANADIVFTGERQYDKDGNIINVDKKNTKEDRKKALLAMFDNIPEDSDVFEEAETDIGDAVGAALYKSARELCLNQVPESCATDVTLLTPLYSTQIRNDCTAFKVAVDKKQKEADEIVFSANKDIRDARLASFNDANQYDRGQCMLEFRKCMTSSDVCGSDWSRCVNAIASENMQITAVSTAKAKIQHISQFEITNSTMESLDSKRNICENILNKCVAVREFVWTDFLREVAPDLKIAELNAESNKRQSCLTDISTCIQKACKDDIVGKGTATMDSCLSRPDMARSFCKVQIDSCERMEPLIWGYVKDKLAAMRVDACTAEVKECFTSEDRCGKDFKNCIGMDYEYIHDICPLDKLVVCKANNKDFSMQDLDSMLMGLYLNIDNSALENCQNVVNTKMQEICGSTTDCNKFASDDTIGTSSIRSQKDGSVYRVTGMISFGSIKMGDATGKTTDISIKDDETGEAIETFLSPGQIGVQEYLSHVKKMNSSVVNADGIISGIDAELNNIAGTINRVIEMIEQDPKIQYCISGRDLGQITGATGDKTTARFPNLLNSVKMQIAIAALRQANDNYNKKINQEITKATKDASADLAQYMCQKMAESGVATVGAESLSTPLTPPYAISYDVGAGLTTDMLLSGGHGSSQNTIAGVQQDNQRSGKYSSSNRKTSVSGGSTTESWAAFNRETRTCHLCKSTVTVDCSNKKSSGFLGIGASNKSSCDTSDPVETCEDIPM